MMMMVAVVMIATMMIPMMMVGVQMIAMIAIHASQCGVRLCEAELGASRPPVRRAAQRRLQYSRKATPSAAQPRRFLTEEAQSPPLRLRAGCARWASR